MKCKLVKLSKEYKNQFMDMMEEWKTYNDTHDCNKSPGIIFNNDYHDFDNYLAKLEYFDPNGPFVPGSVFFCLDEERNVFVGAVHIRHYLNQNLYETGGHIGDGIRPSERRKGYATLMIGLALEKAKELGIRRVLITCYTDNIASAKTIQRNGGVFVNEVLEDGIPCSRYWIDLDPFFVKGDRVTLRDFIDGDIKDRYYWEATDTEWKNWDGPWEKVKRTPEEMEKHLKQFVIDFEEKSKKTANLRDELRTSLEIIADDGKHIGWVISYHIDESYEYTPNEGRLAVGIIIPPQSYRHKGYGSEALRLYFAYLKDKGIKDIYLQTWSGNEPMKKCAEKVGLVLENVRVGIRNVNGKKYDALTYILK